MFSDWLLWVRSKFNTVFWKLTSANHSNSMHKNKWHMPEILQREWCHFSMEIPSLWCSPVLLTLEMMLYTASTCFILPNYLHNSLWFANVNTLARLLALLNKARATNGKRHSEWRNDEHRMGWPWKRFSSWLSFFLLICKLSYINLLLVMSQ